MLIKTPRDDFCNKSLHASLSRFSRRLRICLRIVCEYHGELG